MGRTSPREWDHFTSGPPRWREHRVAYARLLELEPSDTEKEAMGWPRCPSLWTESASALPADNPSSCGKWLGLHLMEPKRPQLGGRPYLELGCVEHPSTVFWDSEEARMVLAAFGLTLVDAVW